MENKIIKEADIQAAIDAGKGLVKLQYITPQEAKIGEKSLILVPEGFIIEEVGNNLERPPRKRGRKTFTSAKSFCSYVNKHKNEDETVILADEHAAKFRAVFDDHGAAEPAWGDFTANLSLEFAPEWKVWLRNSHGYKNEHFSQEDFADFIEDNRKDLMVGTFTDSGGVERENLSALELTGLISKMQITANENITSKIDQRTGDRVMLYENEEIGKDSWNLPSMLFIVVPIYKNADPFRVSLRLRYRKNHGSPRFYYIIDNIEENIQAAFDKICLRVEKGNIGSEEDESKQFAGVDIEPLKAKIADSE